MEEESYLKNEENIGRDVDLDESIMVALLQKYQSYFDEHKSAIESEPGVLFNGLVAVREELEAYFTMLELRSELLQNKVILDIGASSHFFDDYCKQKYAATVVALDVDHSALGEEHDMAVVADSRALPFKEESFDIVVSNCSMPHMLVPCTDDSWNCVPLIGEQRERIMSDLLSVFRESFRVIKKGGQVRMSTVSENKEITDYMSGENFGIEGVLDNGEVVNVDEVALLQQGIDRVNLIKEALSIFENETGAKCLFKDHNQGGLIIIMKI